MGAPAHSTQMEQKLLSGCSHKVQEYVRLERYQEAVIGNSPVIGIDMASEPDRSVEVRYLAPPGYVMVPKVVTPEIGNAINEVGQRCTCGNCSQRLWDLLLASAPVQVDIEMLASALKNAPLAPSDNQGRPRAPVVPPAIEPDYKVIKSILPTANPDEYACCIAADMWNACRDAMLKVNKNASTELPNDANLSTNSPVSPGGWISCSERMPAQDDWVLIYSKYGEYLAGQVQGEYVELNDGTLSWLGAALHWMPLPAAPQHEVK